VRNSVAFPHLLRSPLLSDLPDDQKAEFLDRCLCRLYQAPTEILTQGDPAPGFFLIAQGWVEVSFCDPEGNVNIVHIAGSGEVLGEVEALSENACAATCTTMPHTAVLFCPTPLLHEQIRLTAFVRNLAVIFYERLKRDNFRRASDNFHSVDQRLCLYLTQRSTVQRPEIRISQAYLAVLIGCSRQTVNRKLADLRDEGAIRLGRGAIQVLDRARLEREVNDAGKIGT